MSSRSPDQAQTIGFLLIPGFALMSYASAIEPLRAANLFAGKTLYRWIHISHKGDAVSSSSGAAISCAARIGDDLDLDLLLVCAGGNPAEFSHRPTLAWLRRLAQRGLRIGGVSGGPFILARAGIMGGYRMTIHWEHAQAFAEEFPDLMLTRARYVIDRNRLTCAGGVAPLDMMHALIAEKHGHGLATRTSDWFLHTEIHPGGGPQRISLADRYGVHRRDLIAALELMQNNLGEPLSRESIARAIGLSTRQLDRLFARHLGKSFADHYRAIRIEAAGELLRHSALTITEIAIACGFANASHFSTSFKAETGISPSAGRR
jgi:transcriptional regulator GlxA family with amidase domain